MQTGIRLVIAVFVAILAAPATGEQHLTPHSAQYKVKISLASGQLNTTLTRDGDRYVANHVIKTTGMSRVLSRGKMDVTSTFDALNGTIQPAEFRSHDTIRKDPDVRLAFDWQANEARGTVGDEAVVFPLDGLSHDNVSIQYALMFDLMNGGTAPQYTLFDVDKMRVANISDAGMKTIKTKAGTFEAIGIRHQKEGSSRVTTMWCAAELDYLPVVIEQHRKGKLNFRATLSSYDPAN